MTALRRPVPAGLLIARLMVGGIFLVAALDKVQAPGAFADAVRAFHVLPPGLVVPVASILPWLELLVAVYLIAGFLGRPAAAGSILLLAGFIAALSDSLATGNVNHACGCFGSGAHSNPVLAFLAGGDRVTWWDIERDIILIVLAAAVAIAGPGAFAMDTVLRRRRQQSTRASRRSHPARRSM